MSGPWVCLQVTRLRGAAHIPQASPLSPCPSIPPLHTPLSRQKAHIRSPHYWQETRCRHKYEDDVYREMVRSAHDLQDHKHSSPLVSCGMESSLESSKAVFVARRYIHDHTPYSSAMRALLQSLVGLLSSMDEVAASELHCGSHVDRLLSKLPPSYRDSFIEYCITRGIILGKARSHPLG
uniref:Uncharacterized protein n=1 Tax=Knipowitschia caucasica TaxID=637954 RepID=A0AAV2J1U4_KNICA